MKANERLVYFFELLVETNKAKASPPPLIEVVGKLKIAFDASTAVLELNKGTATIEILDMSIDVARGLVTFYFRHADKNGADVYFANPVAGTSRVERKQQGEGRGFGGHFSVSLTPRAGTVNVYAAMLEGVPGVSSSFVVRLLQSILRTMYQVDGNLFVCDDISGARDRHGMPKKVGFRPMLSLRGLPSAQFVADLQAGTVQEVQLIEDKHGAQLGARPWLLEEASVVKLRVVDPARAIANMWDSLTAVFREQSAAVGIARARIKFKRADGGTDTVEVDAETGTMLDQRYVKAKRIEAIDPILDECADHIVPHFAALIEAELVANRT